MLADRLHGLAGVDAIQCEAGRVAVEPEDAAARHERDGPAGPVDTGRADAGSADEIDLRDERPPRVLRLQQDDSRHDEVQVRGAEGAGEANVAPRVVTCADEVDVRPAVDLRAPEEKRIDAALRGAVEELAPAVGEEVVPRAAQHRDAHVAARASAGKQRGRSGDRGERAHCDVVHPLEQAGDRRDEDELPPVAHGTGARTFSSRYRSNPSAVAARSA